MSQEQDKKREQRERWINAHLDGLLKPEQQEQFNRALASSKSLRDELEAQQRIDQSLRRRLEPPAASAILARIKSGAAGAVSESAASSTGPPSARPGRKFWTPAVKYTALAASLLLLAGGGYWTWISMQDMSSPTLQIAKSTEPTSRPLFEVYADTVRQGFKPIWVCETDKQFFQTTYQRFGHAVMLAATMPKDYKALGWSYGLSISPRTAYLLCDVKGEKVIVFIDLVEKDLGQSTKGEPGLHLHKRKVGELVLYEVSKLKRPRMLEHFYEKDESEVPPNWVETARPVRPPAPGRT